MRNPIRKKNNKGKSEHGDQQWANVSYGWTGFFFLLLFYDAVVLRRDTSTSSWLRELPLLSSSVAFLSWVEKRESVCRGVRGSSFKNRSRDLRFINTPNRNRRMAWYLQKLSPARMFTYFREEEGENKAVNQQKKHTGGDRQSSGTVCTEFVYLTGFLPISGLPKF